MVVCEHERYAIVKAIVDPDIGVLILTQKGEFSTAEQHYIDDASAPSWTESEVREEVVRALDVVSGADEIEIRDAQPDEPQDWESI